MKTGRIRQDVIERVREATDIVALVAGYVTLKRSGSSHKGLCPFHQEKTPSFHVSSERGFYKCFGCGAAGSPIDFVIQMDKVTFPEAVEMLAERAGIPIEREESRGAAPEGTPKADIYRVNRWAAEFFRRRLYTDEGQACRAYLEKRGLSEEMWTLYGIGYAPESWDAMVGAARKNGVPIEGLVDAGLVKARDEGNGHYDRFRNRLVFPINDAMERVIAFGARSLDGSEPKYLNSPETAVFSKGRCLYSIEHLRHLKANEPVFVMEGYTDVIMAYQMGVKSAVATLGTALTEMHANVLSRYTSNVVLLYDGDAAGRKAAERGVGLFLASDFELKVAVLEGNEDPCDFFKRTGSAGAAWITERTTDFLDFAMRETLGRHDVTSLTGRVRAADELLEMAKRIQNPVKRGAVIDRIAQDLSLAKPDLLSRLGSIKAPILREEKKAAPQALPPVVVPAEVTKARHLAEETIVRYVLNVPLAWAVLDRLRPDDFRHPAFADFMAVAFEAHASKAAVPVDTLLLRIEDPSRRHMLYSMIGEISEEVDRMREKLDGDVNYLIRSRAVVQYKSVRERGVADDATLREIVARRREMMGKKKEDFGAPREAPAAPPPSPSVPESGDAADDDIF